MKWKEIRELAGRQEGRRFFRGHQVESLECEIYK
jgi:hypothetical protein